MRSPDPLDQLLRSWNPSPDVPGDLPRQVWHRIATAGEVADDTGVRSIRGRVAALAAAVVVIAGFSLGILSEHQSVERDRDAYFNRIDPIAQAQ